MLIKNAKEMQVQIFDARLEEFMAATILSKINCQ